MQLNAGSFAFYPIKQLFVKESGLNLNFVICIHLLTIAKVEILTVRKYYSNQRYARISTNVHQQRYKLCKLALLPILKCNNNTFLSE